MVIWLKGEFKFSVLEIGMVFLSLLTRLGLLNTLGIDSNGLFYALFYCALFCSNSILCLQRTRSLLSLSLSLSLCLLHCLVLLQNLFSLPRIKVLSFSLTSWWRFLSYLWDFASIFLHYLIVWQEERIQHQKRKTRRRRTLNIRHFGLFC
ncbi:hypothetical protein RJT34_25152 [Clitoria ternatea]|uniref:Uncharacterized protein n=1 Tax=Clitoria ternatea TaxID=43366 RepID=A0AAN9IJS8_CLITE